MTIKNPSFQEALAVLLQRQRESGKLVIDYPISLLQRHFRLGYTPTVALMNELEKRGFVHRTSETAIQLKQDSKAGNSQQVIAGAAILPMSPYD